MADTKQPATNSLAEIQSKLKVAKKRYNSFGKYNFRNSEDVLEAAKLVVNPMGFHITCEEEVVLIGDRYYVKSTATLSNGTETYSKSSMAREGDGKKGMDESQLTCSTSSYARKYALGGLFAIDDGEDTDSDDNASDSVGSADEIRSSLGVEVRKVSQDVAVSRLAAVFKQANIKKISEVKTIEDPKLLMIMLKYVANQGTEEERAKALADWAKSTTQSK